MDSQSKPVLVVGGTGFLGRQVVAELVARGKDGSTRWSGPAATPAS